MSENSCSTGRGSLSSGTVGTAGPTPSDAIPVALHRQMKSYGSERQRFCLQVNNLMTSLRSKTNIFPAAGDSYKSLSSGHVRSTNMVGGFSFMWAVMTPE
jgi:hypothetical protein